MRRLLEALRDAGGRPYLVGGAVRDALLGRPHKDLDVEVFGLALPRLKEALARVGRVDAVGEAFTVFKVTGLEGADGAVDVSLPRRDSKAGPGHRGIAVTGDTFGEDPLRELRAVQLAARFELEVDPETARRCASMPLAELPAERVFGEIQKLLLKARRPSRGLALLREWEMLPAVAPELIPLIGTQQDPEWHPEGDVWIHTLMAVDQAVPLLDDLDTPHALAVMLGTLCHDLGKPATTQMLDGRLRSYGHEEAGLAPTNALLDRWNVHRLHGYDVRGQVLGLVGNHLKPGQLYDDRDRVGDGAIRRLARKCEPALLYRVARADCLGRTGEFPPLAMEWFLDRVRQLEVAERPPDPLLRGRHVLELGLRPGPEVGRIVSAVYERQLDGVVRTLDEAREEARRLLAQAEAGVAPPAGRDVR